MSEQAPLGAVFLTSPPSHSRRMLAKLRERFPRIRWTVYVRESDRHELAADLEGCDVRSDKPSKGKLRFIREIRHVRYKVAACAWQGDASYNRMKYVHAICRADKKLCFNRNANSFPLVIEKDPVWLIHIQRARAEQRPQGSRGAGLYRDTLGRVLGGFWTLVRLARLRSS